MANDDLTRHDRTGDGRGAGDDELDARIRAFTRRVVQAAPVPPELEARLEGPRAQPALARRVARPALALAAAAAVLVVAVAVRQSGQRPTAVATAGGERIELTAERDGEGAVAALRSGESGDTLVFGLDEIGDGRPALCFSVAGASQRLSCITEPVEGLMANISLDDGVRRLVLWGPTEATVVRVDIGEVTVWQQMEDGLAFISSIDVPALVAQRDSPIRIELFDDAGRSLLSQTLLASPETSAGLIGGQARLVPPDQLGTPNG